MTGETILAIDSATGPCSVAVWKDGRVAAYKENLHPAAQSSVLMPMIEAALADSGIGYGDLSAVAATVGPGSFTGIRVGLAAARGIAFAAGIKSLGFTTLETMAFAARARGERILSLLHAGKGEYYYQLFEAVPGWRALSEPMLGALEQAMALSKGAVIAGNVEGATSAFPRADALAELAATRTAAQPLKAFYIRPPDAKLPVKKL